MTQERENQLFERMLNKYGAEILEQKIQKREITRKYYRRWPYDGWSKRVSLDVVDLKMPSNPLAEIIAKEGREALLAGLTPRELQVARWSEDGYKPYDMATMRGKETSNADRWIKHSVKLKFIEKLESEDVIKSEHEPNNTTDITQPTLSPM